MHATSTRPTRSRAAGAHAAPNAVAPPHAVAPQAGDGVDFDAIVDREVADHAAEWDRDEAAPGGAIEILRRHGFLGATLPREYGGLGWDAVTCGRLHEAFGRGSSALTNVLTVQAMVAMTLLRWGTSWQRHDLLPALARGEVIGAFALTEPEAGSALDSLTTSFAVREDAIVIDGVKQWISCGQVAGLFLVFGALDGRSAACLVPAGTRGMRVEPITGMMGFRGAALARITFDGAAVPAVNLVGKPGFGLSHVAPVGLHAGRISTANSALGLLRGCVEQAATRAATRRVGARRVGDVGMARSLIARMAADLAAATGLCRAACAAEDAHDPDAFERALVAKYFTSRAAVRAASDAVQVWGAAGCHASAPVSRYYRDARILEIIEGTSQVHEDLIGRIVVDRAAAGGRRALPPAGGTHA